MSSSASGKVGFTLIVRDGKLWPRSDNSDRKSASSYNVSGLVTKLCQDHHENTTVSSGLVDFNVTVHNDHLRIEHVNTAVAGDVILLEGTWTVKGSSTDTRTPKQYVVHGRSALVGLLLEVTVAQQTGGGIIDLERAQLLDGQLQNLSQLIKTSWWHNLTRSIQLSNPALSKVDTKVLGFDPQPRIYVPCGAPEQFQYYANLAKRNPELRLDVQPLPEPPLTVEYIQSLNNKPGLLSLAMRKVEDANGSETLVPLPYVVPGGRFNELYGWDTYFTILGLLEDGLLDLCTSMLRSFCFCIQHYGKIFNANRTYYLGRSQPPFLTSMGTAVGQKLGKDHEETLELMELTLFASIKEYHTVWMVGEHYDSQTGLSRYFGEGKGFPPEVEPNHYDDELGHLAAKYSMSLPEFTKAYNVGDIKDAELDQYLRHDRSGRESGHDTTYRFVGRAANLATVDLNSCLYKYETDIASLIDTYFRGQIEIPDTWRAPGISRIQTSAPWMERAAKRRKAMTKYLWCSESGLFFDYDTVEHVQTSYENATTFWPIWAGVASQTQAESVVTHGLPKLEAYGGLMASTRTSRGEVSPARPQRQWDFPYGWAPHQMLAWVGLRNYGYDGDAERLIYRWITMVTKTFTNYNGLVVEKYDVTSKDNSHVVKAEYGNQGSDFSSEVQTGFAWTNASLVYGANLLRRS